MINPDNVMNPEYKTIEERDRYKHLRIEDTIDAIQVERDTENMDYSKYTKSPA